MNDNNPLLNCPDTRSCVSSTETHPDRFVEPLPGGPDSLPLIRAVMEGMPGARIESMDERSLHATYRSRWLGFVDDVHVVVCDHHVHIRSKSRVGYYDFGVNRRRVQTIANQLRALENSKQLEAKDTPP